MKKIPNIKTSQIIREFWKGIKPDKNLFYVAFSLFFLSQVVNIIVPIYYKRFFDAINLTTDRYFTGIILIKIIIIIALLHFLGWTSWRIAMNLYNTMQARSEARLKQNSFNYMSKHSYSFFTNNFTGSLVQRVSRFSRSFEVLCDVITFNIMPVTVTVLGSIIVVWFVAPILSFVIISWVVLFIIFNFFFSTWKIKYDMEAAELDSKTTGYLADAITNNNAVSFFTGYDYESKGFRNVSDEQARKTRFLWLLGEIVDGVQAFFIILVEVFVFYYGVKY